MIGDMDLLSPLNPKQKGAVVFHTGPAIVLSGPGSGKTRVITHRIAYLIKEREVPPSQILPVTFTNKAANEMKERVAKLLGSPSTGNKIQQGKHVDRSRLAVDLPTMGTFHWLCAKILRADGGPMGLGPSFVIFDEADSLNLIKEVLKELNIDPKEYSPGKIKNSVEGAKNELVDAEKYADLAYGFFQEEIISRVYPLYQKKLAEHHAADFEDLLLKTVTLFQKYPNVLKKYQYKWEYILVDEYQDTNKVQYLLTKLLSGAKKNIFIVGDAAQAIYGWRGADFRNILNFSQDFPESKVFHLEQNYRSTQKILAAATTIISQNRSHPILKLWTENVDGNPIVIYEARNEIDEAEFVTRVISKLKGGEQFPSYDSFAVLYRTNAQSRIIEEAFLREGIPYILVGGVRFYERREVKDVLSFLRLILNDHDDISRKRIVNVPPRGIGPATLSTRGPKFEEFK